MYKFINISSLKFAYMSCTYIQLYFSWVILAKRIFRTWAQFVSLENHGTSCRVIIPVFKLLKTSAILLKGDSCFNLKSTSYVTFNWTWIQHHFNLNSTWNQSDFLLDFNTLFSSWFLVDDVDFNPSTYFQRQIKVDLKLCAGWDSCWTCWPTILRFGWWSIRYQYTYYEAIFKKTFNPWRNNF